MRPVAAALVCGLVLQGCAGAVAQLVHQAETERLAEKRQWEARLDGLDCAGLAAAGEALEAERDDLVDFDQRSEFLADRRADQGCAET